MNRSLLVVLLALFGVICGRATPANRAALEKHFGPFLVKGLRQCTTCHQPSTNSAPESLDDFPHNAFGARLRKVGAELAHAGKKKDIPSRLQIIGREDSDGDGVDNLTELLLGFSPGDPASRPSSKDRGTIASLKEQYRKFLASYKWEPFESVRQPKLPALSVNEKKWGRNGIDAFIAADVREHSLKPRPEASKEILLRRAYMDLIGLNPTPQEQRTFLEDKAPDSYERLVDRLLEDERYGERWGRHWMDVWRYSDWAGWSGGNQIRDSQPHIWRWRDWIVESLNDDKSYDRMILEMLAADEFSPGDTKAVRATGFLVRNYKMLSREQWLEDTIKHTSQAFLGVTVGCAKCHNHMFDPISQAEYYQMRAIFEPHQVRIDRVPGELDRLKNGLARVFDTGSNAPTYFYNRGDERKPDTNRIMTAGIPAALRGATRRFEVEPVHLPRSASFPDKLDYVIQDSLRDLQAKLKSAEADLEKARSGETNATKVQERELKVKIAAAQYDTLKGVIELERMEDEGKKNSEAWKSLATVVVGKQSAIRVLEEELNVHNALGIATEAETKLAAASETKEKEKLQKKVEESRKKKEEAEKKLADARKEAEAAVSVNYKPRTTASFPVESTGRRLAFARWVADGQNPLTARVAVNHIWLRHFGQALVPTPADFGRNGKPPVNPKLVDWLAGEFVKSGWSMKAMHRLIMTSSTYRMASTPDPANEKIDPDNLHFWRVPSRRLEAEAVRDNLLHVAGDLDLTMGGPEIDHNLGLTSKRRSVYLRIAPEKEVEFLKVFDSPNVTECYERHPSVMPQQALALSNSELALAEARRIAKLIGGPDAVDEYAFVRRSYEKVLARSPRSEELTSCVEFLRKKPGMRQRENLALVLLNHNDFITIR